MKQRLEDRGQRIEITLSAYIAHSIQDLKEMGVDNPQLDARLLICHALKCDRADLLSQSQRILSAQETAAIDDLIARRLQREPVARILGQREFWGLNFDLNEATLEPRPDSETLIEAALSSFRRKPESSSASARHMNLDSYARYRERWIPASQARAGMTTERDIHNPRILDLGTGTGCLLLSLLHEIPTATGIGIDINPRAVKQATQNATALGLQERVKFIISNWFDGITEQPAPPSSPAPRGRGEGRGNSNNYPQKFDIILSNPPYIPASDIPTLMPEVRDYDPMLALDGGNDGLAPYRFLIPQLKNFLNPNGIGAFEIGIGQAQQVTDLFREYGFTNIETHKDLGGVERCVSAFVI